MKYLKENFAWKPLLILMIPLALFTLPGFSGFQQGDFALIQFEASTVILPGQESLPHVTAGSVSLYQCFSTAGGMANVCFLFSIIAGGVAGVYAVVAAFVKRLRGVGSFLGVMSILLGLSALASVFGYLLLANYVDGVTTDYYAQLNKIVTKSHALTRTNLIFYVAWLLPAVAWLWMLWVFILNVIAAKKARPRDGQTPS